MMLSQTTRRTLIQLILSWQGAEIHHIDINLFAII